ncbi:MAG: adenine phosphoribosyltransferase [Paludibacteraceae bacterium]|nr:adenine phosphoribosyltransferase [Paludibacteraceae bacterium]
MTLQQARDLFRIIQDFPKKGIGFIDITTVMKKPQATTAISDAICDYYKDKGITKVVAMESRGFFFGSIISEKLGAGFIPARKPGKLPGETYKATFDKEYGQDTIEIHKDGISTEDVVLIHDDILATGGTAAAAIDLVKKAGVKKIYFNTIGEIDFLKGREKIASDVEYYNLFHF